MTEFVSAHDYAMAILQRPIEHLAAMRVQRTWRSWKIHRESSIQRALAMMNKCENSEGISWKKGSAERNEIKDLLEGMEVKKKGTKITFGEKNVAKDGEKTFFEEINGEDGKMKSQTIFTYMVNTWYSHLEDKGSFFEKGFIKKWIDDPTSSHWMEYLDDTIKLLESSGFVLLWGNNGGHKRLYRKDKKKIIDLRNYWKLYQLNEQISKLKEGSKKTVKTKKRKMTSLSGGLNPRAMVFTMEPTRDVYNVLLNNEERAVDYIYLD